MRTAIVSYFDARHEIDELLDALLAQSASLLIAQAGHELEEFAEHSPDVRLSPRDEGFSDAQIDGRRWRVFSGWDRERRYLVQVAERVATRNELVGGVAKTLLLPLAVALPVLAILIWVAIERVTRPLRMLNREVAQRAPDNLAPLEFADAPTEVAPLVTNANRAARRYERSSRRRARIMATGFAHVGDERPAAPRGRAGPLPPFDGPMREDRRHACGPARAGVNKTSAISV